MYKTETFTKEHTVYVEDTPQVNRNDNYELFPGTAFNGNFKPVFMAFVFVAILLAVFVVWPILKVTWIYVLSVSVVLLTGYILSKLVAWIAYNVG